MRRSSWAWLKSLPQGLLMSAPDPRLQDERIYSAERNVGLPVKAVIMTILLYFLYLSHWSSGEDVSRGVALEAVTRRFAQDVIQLGFLVYLALNVAAAFVLLGMRQLPLALVEWTVYVVGLIDGVFLAGLTVVTGGFDSILYWFFLGLIVRNSISVPSGALQVVMNLAMSCLYVTAGFVDLRIAQMDNEQLPLFSQEGGAEPFMLRSALLALLQNESYTWLQGRQVAEAFMLRLMLLFLVTAVCYGVQVLLDRQRRAEDEAREFALRQEQLQSSGRLAAEIAHQLKNPLAIINNASFTLQRTVREGKTITQQIQIIREEVDRADRIITELMGYSKLSEGRVERLDVKEELEQAVRTVFPPAVQYDVRIERDYAGVLPNLLAQRGHLADAFVNVLQNAREALGGRGELRLTTRTNEKSEVVVTIEDSGPGIPPETLARIFEPYYTTKDKGTGLGLAIVRHNVEMYGGSVTVESTLGKGAAFTLRFPARTLMRLRT